MKIVGTKVANRKIKRKLFSVRLDEKLIQDLDKLRKEANLGRKEVLEAILRKVFSDPRFILHIDEL